MDKINFEGKRVVALVAVSIFVISGFLVFRDYISTRNVLIAKEEAISAQYRANQNSLSTMITTVKESMGIANANAEAVDTILSNAIQGRLPEGKTAGNGGESAIVINAVAEAYPQLEGVSVNYANVQVALVSSRKEFQNKQDRLQDMLRDYNSWRAQGFLRPIYMNFMGAPTHTHLRAQIGDSILTGQEALNKMSVVIQTEQSRKSFETGNDTGIEIEGFKKDKEGSK